jgi:hypothetical protein
MGFVKGKDGKARSIKNPLEGSIGDADLGDLTLVSLGVSGNISGSVLYTPAVANNWSDAASVTNVTLALDALAQGQKNILEGDAQFLIAGPFSNDAQAAGGNVPVGGIYYNASGGLVIRQT